MSDTGPWTRRNERFIKSKEHAIGRSVEGEKGGWQGRTDRPGPNVPVGSALAASDGGRRSVRQAGRLARDGALGVRFMTPPVKGFDIEHRPGRRGGT